LKTIGSFPAVFLGVFVLLGPAASRARADEAKDAAHEHFDRALAANNAQHLAEAAAEFQKAYELWPDYKVLYNIGRVRLALGQPVEVVDAFEAYLVQGAKELTDERREEVKRALEEQRARIATISVQTAAGADVRLDGRLLGPAPLPGPLRLAAGRHTVEAILPDRPSELRELELQGGSTLEVVLTFPPRPELAAPAPAAPRAPALSLAAPPREASRSRRTMGYVVGSVGAALLLAGAAVAVEGALAANDAKARLVTAATPPPPGMPDVLQYDAAKRTYDDAKTRNQLGWAVGGVGVAALIGGAAMVYLSSGTGPERSAHGVAANVVAQPGTIGIRGQW
jgi:tetratricopeptide (TPR) repeat protein